MAAATLREVIATVRGQKCSVALFAVEAQTKIVDMANGTLSKLGVPA